MEIRIDNSEKCCVVAIAGRLDTNTAVELDGALGNIAASEVILDCTALEYVSSAGLRVILATHKRLSAAQCRLVLRGVRAEVRSVFDMTGFSRILNIE